MAIAIPSANQSAINAALAQAVVVPLQEKSTFLSLPGIQIIDTAAPLRIPIAAATAPAAAFTAAGAQITEQAVALTEKVLLPTCGRDVRRRPRAETTGRTANAALEC